MTNEEAKREAIRKSWADIVGNDNVKDIKYDENGWSNWRCRRYYDRVKDILIQSKTVNGGKSGNDFRYRPKSLYNLRDNNGWTRIEPDGSNLPADGEHIVLFTNFSIVWTYQFLREVWEDEEETKPTHFKPIEEDKPPIW